MKKLGFLFSLQVQIALLCIMLSCAGFALFRTYRRNQAETVPAAYMTAKAPTGAKADAAVVSQVQAVEAVKAVSQQAGGAVVDLVLPATPRDEKDNTPVIPEEVRKTMLADATPLTLFSVRPAAPKAKPRVSETYAPYGRQIKCRLVNAVDSANIETPLIGVVTEDVWNRDQNGVAHKIIARGDEVHGSASKGRSRDRIDANGRFVIVRRNADDEENGVELTLIGTVLNRDYDEATGLYGLKDGSAGIIGNLIETSEYAELKLFVATFLSNAAAGMKETSGVLNFLTGEERQSTKGGWRTALAQGSSTVAQEYADRVKESIGKDGYYVAVHPGKQFYLYVKETIDFSRAMRGGASAAPQEPQNADDSLAQLTSRLSNQGSK